MAISSHAHTFIRGNRYEQMQIYLKLSIALFNLNIIVILPPKIEISNLSPNKKQIKRNTNRSYYTDKTCVIIFLQRLKGLTKFSFIKNQLSILYSPYTQLYYFKPRCLDRQQGRTLNKRISAAYSKRAGSNREKSSILDSKLV